MKRNHIHNTDYGVYPWPMFEVTYWGPDGLRTRYLRSPNEALAKVMVRNRVQVFQFHDVVELKAEPVRVGPFTPTIDGINSFKDLEM